jgi:hypothetical protein
MILIATGIADKCPDLEVMEASVEGSVRHCPIRDGFEAIDKKIAVYGPSEGAAGKARFFRIFSPFVTLIPSGLHKGGPASDGRDFAVAPSPARKIIADAKGVEVVLTGGSRLQFDVLYPAGGCGVHSHLVTELGAKSDAIGCLVVDGKQQSTVAGITPLEMSYRICISWSWPKGMRQLQPRPSITVSVEPWRAAINHEESRIKVRSSLHDGVHNEPFQALLKEVETTHARESRQHSKHLGGQNTLYRSREMARAGGLSVQ